MTAGVVSGGVVAGGVDMVAARADGSGGRGLKADRHSLAACFPLPHLKQSPPFLLRSLSCEVIRPGMFIWLISMALGSAG